MDAFLSVFKYTNSPEGSDIDMSGDGRYDIHLAAYDILGRLEDVPVTTEPLYDCSGEMAFSTRKFGALNHLSGEWPFYYAEEMDHMPTPIIASEEIRAQRAANGRAILDRFVEWSRIDEAVEMLNDGDAYHKKLFKKYPWL